MKLTIDKTKFQAVLDEIAITELAMIELENKTHEVDASDPFDSDFTGIHATIEEVRIWANQKILEANQEEVMDNFLAEMKVVFDKYAASMEVGSDESGYGTNYGGGSSVGVKFVATFDGVTTTKSVDKTVIVGSDLV